MFVGVNGMNRIRTPVILQQSFRPFFLLAGAWATLCVLLWVGSLAGLPVLPDAVDALAWHKHEMLFGFATAAIAGFILTAIPNWTGGLPISGWPLASLVGLWALGRFAFLLPEVLGPWAVAALDLSFLFVLVATIARELIGGKNARNFPVLGLIALIATGNVAVHLQRLGLGDTADTGYRLTTFVLAMLTRAHHRSLRHHDPRGRDAGLPRPYRASVDRRSGDHRRLCIDKRGGDGAGNVAVARRARVSRHLDLGGRLVPRVRALHHPPLSGVHPAPAPTGSARSQGRSGFTCLTPTPAPTAGH